MMTLGSLFDGSGGFPLAGIRCGITPLWASEIEPYPIAVTRHHFAGMKHLGDITKINGSKIQPVDVITFGSPCQDLSVAGKRAGIHEGTRSNLFFEAIRIIREMREATHGEYPKYAVWENVHGAFSSAKGEDFRCVLEEFVCTASGEQISIPMPANGKWLPAGEIVGDGYSIAWRVLDAQYFPGTPQRRKRIYLVADFAGERAGKILFERDGMSGDPESCEEAREGAAENAAGGAGGSDRACLSFHQQQDPISSEAVAPCLSGQDQASVCVASFMGGQASKAGGIGYAEEVTPTLKAAPSGGNTVPDVVYAINDKATRNRGGGPTRHDDGAGNGLGVQDDGVMYTLDTASKHAVCYPETALCLTARHDSSPCVDRGQNVVALDCRNLVGNEGISGTLQAKNEGGFSLNFVNPIVYSSGSYGALSEGVGCIGTGARATAEIVAIYDCRGNGDGSIVPTLTGDHQNRVTDYTAVCVGNGQLHNISMAEQMNTLDCMHDQQAVLTSGKPPRRYIVRRLTPLECCRLQGFPDGWGDIPQKESMTNDEALFWESVLNTRNVINGKPEKRYAKASILKWYNRLHTDSAEYKMWGNGIALPCALYVLEGIAEALYREQYD